MKIITEKAFSNWYTRNQDYKNLPPMSGLGIIPELSPLLRSIIYWGYKKHYDI